MNQQRIYDWIKHPEKLNRESLYELRTLLAKYPYFHTARLLYLKNLYLLHDISFGEELRRSALYINDRKALFYLVEGDRYTLKALEKKLPELPGQLPPARHGRQIGGGQDDLLVRKKGDVQRAL